MTDRLASPAQPLDRQHRLGAFDLLRFLAAAMVVVFHHGAWDGRYLHSPLFLDDGLVGIVKYGKFGVDIFFIISGYFVFLTADGRDWKSFCVARLSRIYPALLVFCTVSFVVIALWGALPPADTPRLKNYLGNITLASFVTAFLPGFSGAGYVEGVYWTLAYEFVWYAAVALFLVRGRIGNAQPLLMALTGASALLWLLLWSGRNEKIGQIGQYLPYFLLGAQLYLLAHHRATPAAWATLAANAALVVLSIWIRAVGGLVNLPNLLTFDPFIAIALVALATVPMALAATGRLNINGLWITVLGASTYPLYLMHDKTGVVLAQQAAWVRGLPGVLFVLALFLAVAILFARYLEPHLIGAMRSFLGRILGVRRSGRGSH